MRSSTPQSSTRATRASAAQSAPIWPCCAGMPQSAVSSSDSSPCPLPAATLPARTRIHRSRLRSAWEPPALYGHYSSWGCDSLLCAAVACCRFTARRRCISRVEWCAGALRIITCRFCGDRVTAGADADDAADRFRGLVSACVRALGTPAAAVAAVPGQTRALACASNAPHRRAISCFAAQGAHEALCGGRTSACDTCGRIVRLKVRRHSLPAAGSHKTRLVSTRIGVR